MLYSTVGQVKMLEGVVHILTEEGESGCVLYGPYTMLEPGSYEVVFDAMPQEMSGRTCCIVDVLRRGKIVVAEKDFTADELVHRKGRIPVRFEVVERDSFEFRLTATGTAALRVRYHRPLRALPSGESVEAQG